MKPKNTTTTDVDDVQLRYLQTLNSISAEKNSTIVFPVPIDIISKLMSNNSSHHHADRRSEKSDTGGDSTPKATTVVTDQPDMK